MRAVIGWLAIPALVFLACSGGFATSVATNVYDDGMHITYTYTLSSDETNDFITAFHVYAPIDPARVTGWCDNTAWAFDCFYDDEIQASDIYWQADTNLVRGIAAAGDLEFRLQTLSNCPTLHNYVIEGYLGNWGIETESWAGWGTFVMMPSVAVPSNPMPEPSTFALLLSGLSGCVLVVRRRR